AVITVKNVAVKSMYDPDIAWFSDTCSERQPPVKERGGAAHGSGFRRVCMNNIGVLAFDLAVDLKKRKRVFRRKFAAHFRDVDRLYSAFIGEIAHILFAGRNG